MSNNKFTHIIFDMDGVLVDVDEIQKNAVVTTCESFGIVVDGFDWNQYKGLNSEAIFGKIIAQNPSRKYTLQTLVDHKKTLTKKVKDQVNLIYGAVDFLEFCRGEFVGIGLATSSSSTSQHRIFERFYLAKFFDSIMTGDDVSNGKPDPEIYIKSMLNLKAKPENTIIIEDSYSGTKAGLDAGATVITIATSHTRNEILSWGLSNIVTNDYEDIKEIILRLNQH
jgi:beta-phosphoglucomutase